MGWLKCSKVVFFLFGFFLPFKDDLVIQLLLLLSGLSMNKHNFSNYTLFLELLKDS